MKRRSFLDALPLVGCLIGVSYHAAVATELYFCSPDDKLRMNVRVVQHDADESKGEKADRTKFDLTFTLESTDSQGKTRTHEVTSLEARALRPITTVKWSPDSRYVALMYDYGKSQHLTVFKCMQGQVAQVTLPLSKISHFNAQKLDEYGKKRGPDEDVGTLDRYDEDISWKRDGRMVITVSGFTLGSNLPIGFQGKYEVNPDTGRYKTLSWTIHDLDDKEPVAVDKTEKSAKTKPSGKTSANQP